MVKINSNIVMGLAIAMPKLEEQGRILKCLDASDGRLKSETVFADHLRALRSGLMDDLLTGRVRVTQLLT